MYSKVFTVVPRLLFCITFRCHNTESNFMLKKQNKKTYRCEDKKLVAKRDSSSEFDLQAFPLQSGVVLQNQISLL